MIIESLYLNAHCTVNTYLKFRLFIHLHPAHKRGHRTCMLHNIYLGTMLHLLSLHSQSLIQTLFLHSKSLLTLLYRIIKCICIVNIVFE